MPSDGDDGGSSFNDGQPELEPDFGNSSYLPTPEPVPVDHCYWTFTKELKRVCIVGLNRY
jgi:hypothetical protein